MIEDSACTANTTNPTMLGCSFRLRMSPSLPLLANTGNCISLPAAAGVNRACRRSVSYHARSHAGLPAAQPRHGGGDWHLRWREGNGAGLGDVGVRRSVIDVVGAAEQSGNTKRCGTCAEVTSQDSHGKTSSKLLSEGKKQTNKCFIY